MKFGFIPTEGGSYYQEFLEEVQSGESLGFDSIWLEEHHGVKDHYWPSPLIGLAGIATCTERITIGTNILVLPFYHPVRVAEDAAMLDVISKGRFILGAAIGYKPDEFALYNTPMEKRGARFDEAICLIKRLWTEEKVDFDGQFYCVKGFKIEPRPLMAPPVWLGGWGELSLSRAARLGDAWIPGPTANLEKLLQAEKLYTSALVDAKLNPIDRPTPLTREVVIAETDEQAWEMAEKHLLINYRDEYGGGKWKHPLIGQEDPTPVFDLQAVSQERFLIGSPETIIQQLQKFKDAFGVDHLICRLFFPGMPHKFILKELQLLATQVMPVFR